MLRTYDNTFRQLIAWQKAKELTKKIYQLTNSFPKEERYALAIQMKRSSISVMSNIAEGNQRKGKADKLRFFNIALSSLTELDNQSELAYELGYFAKSEYEHLIELINKSGYLISRLSDSLKNLNYPNDPNNRNNPKQGFSLVELIVVISIISVLSVATVVGFNGFGDALKAKEVAGLIADQIKAAELLALKEDYQKIDIHFFEHYLVLAETPPEADLVLALQGECLQEGIGGHHVRAGDTSSGTLQKKDGKGTLMDAIPFSEGQQTCVLFSKTLEAEWSYQLLQDEIVSPLIKFVHLNPDPAFTLDVAGSTYRLEIEAPYAKKTFYVDDFLEKNPISLTIQNNGEPTGETITL